MKTILDRRVVLTGLAALLGGCVAETEGRAPRVARFREIRVDTGPFAAKGVRNYAAKVADRLRVAAAAAFAERLAPGDRSAPVLVLEVSQVRLATWVGGARGLFDRAGGDDDDTMVGALVLLSDKGNVIDRRRNFASVAAASSGDWRLPDNEDRRLDALCRLYAAWAVREYD